jgi:dihydrodipicolinate synthase/N-acetylneuraminate lyase
MGAGMTLGRNDSPLPKRRFVDTCAPMSSTVSSIPRDPAAPWAGVFPAVTTQFHADQSLDLAATARHCDVLIESGVSGLIMGGSLGENQTMQPDEKRAVVRCAVEVARGRVPVLTGVAEMSSRAAAEYMLDCEKIGVAGYMVMPPMVYKPDHREIMHWFRAMAAVTPLPWMLYNNPVGYTADVTPEMFVELADVTNLVAIKESSHNTRRITEIRNLVGDRYQLFTGVDDLMLECAILGIDGWVAGSGIAFPKENQKLWDLTREGRWEEARALYRWTQPLMKLDTHTHFVQYIKLLMQETGLGSEWVREPRLPIAGAEREQVLATIREALSRRPTV